MSDQYTKDGKLIVNDQNERIRRLKNQTLSDQFCPRCNHKAVDKPNRTCQNCHGRLLWADADSGKTSLTEYEPFYVWAKPVATGLEGWYPMEFWNLGFGTKK